MMTGPVTALLSPADCRSVINPYIFDTLGFLLYKRITVFPYLPIDLFNLIRERS